MRKGRNEGETGKKKGKKREKEKIDENSDHYVIASSRQNTNVYLQMLLTCFSCLSYRNS